MHMHMKALSLNNINNLSTGLGTNNIKTQTLKEESYALDSNSSLLNINANKNKHILINKKRLDTHTDEHFNRRNYNNNNINDYDITRKCPRIKMDSNSMLKKKLRNLIKQGQDPKPCESMLAIKDIDDYNHSVNEPIQIKSVSQKKYELFNKQRAINFVRSDIVRPGPEVASFIHKQLMPKQKTIQNYQIYDNKNMGVIN